MDTNQMIIIVSLAVAAMLFSAVLYDGSGQGGAGPKNMT